MFIARSMSGAERMFWPFLLPQLASFYVTAPSKLACPTVKSPSWAPVPTRPMNPTRLVVPSVQDRWPRQSVSARWALDR